MSPAESFEESIVTLTTLGTSSSLHGFRQASSRIQPKTDEQGKGFVGIANVPFEPLDTAVNPVKSFTDCDFLPLIYLTGQNVIGSAAFDALLRQGPVHPLDDIA